MFLKIFLWFGAVVLTFIVATSIAGELMHLRFEGPGHRPPDAMLNRYASDAAEEYERGGQAALTAYLGGIHSHSSTRLFLFNRQLQELSGGSTHADARDVARRVFETGLPEFADMGPSPLLGRAVRAESGEQYVLVAELPPRPMFALFHLHILAMALIGGLFCYWLARHLTSPVAKLRAATRELANGNLSVRVGPTLGRRRDELASLAADFDEMAEKIQLLLDRQRRLLGDISHELRSPLARLNVALELARQRSGVEATSALERIQREAEILNEMIGQLLALTRLESGAEEIKKVELDLEALVNEVVKDADFEARARNRSVRLAATEPVMIEGVPNLIRRAIENVIRNAVHYTAERTEVEINLFTASEATPQSAGNPNNERAVIVVRDHGPGVPDEALNEIFRPFYRVDEARDREAGGVGLGLSIAERAVRLHGGKVAATNAADGGLIVTIRLPLANSRQQTANSRAAEQPTDEGKFNL
ncbi:MAG TPA: ATP-binding protein [Pyrinomonadaceae bacterium]|nr:ATP-binding protein [Pyrinomonadaceae bacterium]